jgi:hypothetical protein
MILKVNLHHFSKIKSQKEATKQWESRFFLLFLLDDRRIRIRTSLTSGSGSRRPKKHIDPTNPDPQYWFEQFKYISFKLISNGRRSTEEEEVRYYI